MHPACPSDDELPLHPSQETTLRANSAPRSPRTRADPHVPEKRWVTRATVDPDDVDRAWLTFSGWRNESSAIPHVFATEDGGATWQDVSGNLPQARCRTSSATR